MAETAASDMEVGLGLAFFVLGLVGAVTMYLAAGAHEQVLSGWGFALAMLTGAASVAAFHVYG
jgi:hypothetical protein